MRVILLVGGLVLASAGRLPKRSVDVQIGGKEVSIVSKSQDETLKDEFKFAIKAEDDRLRADLDYKFADKAGGTKTNTRFDWRVFEIIEFTPSSKDEGSSEMAFKENNVKLSTYPADKAKWVWNDVVQTQDGNTTVLTFSDSGNVLTVIAYVTKEATATLSPQNIKFDVKVSNYPYVNPGNSTLALRTRLHSDTKIKERVAVKNELGQDVVSTPIDLESGPGTPSGEFTWVEKFSSGNKGSKKILVTQSTDSGDKEKGVFFTFATVANETFLWDPTLGVSSVSSAQSIQVSVLLSMLLALFRLL